MTPYIYSEKQDQYTFTTDSQGRIQKVEVSCGDEIYVYGDNAGQVYDAADYPTIIYDYTYGDYWFYTPAN